MTNTFRQSIVSLLLLAVSQWAVWAQTGIRRYVRFSHQGTVSHGILDGDIVRQLSLLRNTIVPMKTQ